MNYTLISLYIFIIFQWNICKDVIAARGPDHLTEKYISLSHHWHGYFAATVLWMQGPEIITQPSLDDNNNLLLWNGDIFSGCLVCSLYVLNVLGQCFE